MSPLRPVAAEAAPPAAAPAVPPGPIAKTAFIGIAHVAHLATGGEAPVLRAHLDATARFLLDKGDGMPGRARFMDVVARARAALARRLGGAP